jgi:hypothetical protein
MSFNLRQPTQFTVKSLLLVTKFGNIDVRAIYQELNIFDSMFMPCMRGNILILDSVGMAEKLFLDGSEYLKIEISKSDEPSSSPLTFTKTFRIYKLSKRTSYNQNSEIFVLDFISDEMIYSLQQKIRQSFVGEHSRIAETVMNRILQIKRPQRVDITKGIHTVIIPNLSPFDTMNWLTKRAVSKENLPDLFFFENKYGYYFASLSSLISEKPITDILYEPKNISDSKGRDFYGARDVEAVRQFNLLENISNGVYSGTLITIDPLTRKKNYVKLDYSDIYGQPQSHLNKNPNFVGGRNKIGLDASQMYDSKVSLYPTFTSRDSSGWIRKNDIQTGKIIDDTHTYVFQRTAIITNLLQTILHVNLPGDFGFTSGLTVNMKMPVKGVKDPDLDQMDSTLTAKYIITAARHIIKGDRHETVLELATDSTNKAFYNVGPDLKFLGPF